MLFFCVFMCSSSHVHQWFFFPIIGAEDCWRERHISQWMQRNNILYFLGNAACYHAVVMLRGLTMRSSVLAARLSHRSIVVIRSLEIFLLFRIWLAVWFCSPLTGWHRHNPHESHEHRCTSDHFVDLNKNTAERQEWRDEKNKMNMIWEERAKTDVFYDRFMWISPELNSQLTSLLPFGINECIWVWLTLF